MEFRTEEGDEVKRLLGMKPKGSPIEFKLRVLFDQMTETSHQHELRDMISI